MSYSKHIINFGIFNFQFILCIFNNYFDIQTGVGRLLNKEVYKAAYPLHDGEYSYTDFEKDDSRRTQNIRQVNQEKIKSTFVIYCLGKVKDLFFQHLFHIFIATLQRMGFSRMLVQEATFVVNPELFRCKNWIILCMVRFLYRNVSASFHCWSSCYYVWGSNRQYTIKQGKVWKVLKQIKVWNENS